MMSLSFHFHIIITLFRFRLLFLILFSSLCWWHCRHLLLVISTPHWRHYCFRSLPPFSLELCRLRLILLFFIIYFIIFIIYADYAILLFHYLPPLLLPLVGFSFSLRHASSAFHCQFSLSVITSILHIVVIFSFSSDIFFIFFISFSVFFVWSPLRFQLSSSFHSLCRGADRYHHFIFFDYSDHFFTISVIFTPRHHFCFHLLLILH